MDYLAPSSDLAENGDQTDAVPESGSPLPVYRAPHYTPARTQLLLQRLEPYRLSMAELVMILNLRPLVPSFLDAVIEEFDQRFSAEQQTEILEIIEDVIGR